MRPQLKPALRRIWRDATTLQVGVDPDRAVVIGGLDPAAASLVETLDGSRDVPGVRAAAERLGLGADRADELIRLLAECGVLEDGASDRRSLAALARADRERLAPDLAAASVLRPRTDGGVPVLARRRTAAVALHGAGRVGASVATLLAAAGIGYVTVTDPAITSAADVTPAGLSADDIGARRQDATARASRRVTQSVRHRLPASRRRPDLAVIAADGGTPPDPALPDRLLRDGVPHLFAGVRESTGVVGPLVLPGRSSCLRCHELHRSDRDPAWPSIAAQLCSAAARGPSPCDVVLATAVAAHAALQVLAFLDGAPSPRAVDGTLEIDQADGQVRRRTWAAHPACGCGWSHRP